MAAEGGKDIFILIHNGTQLCIGNLKQVITVSKKEEDKDKERQTINFWVCICF